ncbi:hypothetical protein Q3G72_031355 [Acer saccharum]|nr:hypothetical protein Q3G72_031355 [Acer saccharum]
MILVDSVAPSPVWFSNPFWVIKATTAPPPVLLLPVSLLSSSTSPKILAMPTAMNQFSFFMAVGNVLGYAVGASAHIHPLGED